jgi:integration host factor subunit beta
LTKEEEVLIKSELARRLVARNPHLRQREVENVVDAILGEISDALARSDRVELRGFGVFSGKRRRARAGRNPLTGDSVPVPEKIAPASGKEVRELLNRR